MGIIQRQSFKYTLINLVGVALGICSTLFVYPRIPEAFGFIRYLQDLSLMALPVFSFGMSLTAIKFYPRFKDADTRNHGFIGLLLTFVAAAIGISTLLGMLFWPQLTALATKSGENKHLLWLFFPFAALTTISTVLYNYAQNHHRIALPSLLMEVLPKFITPIILLGYWLQYCTFETALGMILTQMALATLGLAWFVATLGDWRLNIDRQYLRTTPKLWRELWQYAGYVTIYGLAFILATRTDVIFLGSLNGYATAGAYSIVLFMASTIEIPTRGLLLASNGKIPEHWATDDTRAISELYTKVSVNLTAIATLLLALLIINYNSLVAIMPNNRLMDGSLALVVLLGSAKLFEAVGGMAHAIVYFSDRYKWSLLTLCALAICNITLSLYLVPAYGTTGAAIAACVSAFMYNLFSISFCRYFWRVAPDWLSLGKLLLAGVAAVAAAWFIPTMHYPIVDMVLRTVMCLGVYGAAVWFGRLAPDLVEAGRGAAGRVFK